MLCFFQSFYNWGWLGLFLWVVKVFMDLYFSFVGFLANRVCLLLEMHLRKWFIPYRLALIFLSAHLVLFRIKSLNLDCITETWPDDATGLFLAQLSPGDCFLKQFFSDFLTSRVYFSCQHSCKLLCWKCSPELWPGQLGLTIALHEVRMWLKHKPNI